MMKVMSVLFVMVTVMGSAFADQSAKVSYDSLPNAVKQTLQSLGATKYLKIKKEVEEKSTEYEVKFIAGQTVKEVELSPEGKILELEAREWEKEIAFDDLPSAVKTSFSLIRSSDVEEVEVESMDGLVVYFVEYKDGRELKEVMFSEDGKILFVGDEDECDEDCEDEDEDDEDDLF